MYNLQILTQHLTVFFWGWIVNLSFKNIIPYLSGMEGIGSILIILFWMFIANRIIKFVKGKLAGDGNTTQPKTNTSTTQKKPQQTFQEIFKELQKQMEENQTGKKLPDYTEKNIRPKQPIVQKQQQQKKEAVNLQHVYVSKNIVSDKERQKDSEFKQFVRSERKKEHDAEAHQLDKKIYELHEEEQQGVPFELDLRNAIIGSIILERPYS